MGRLYAAVLSVACFVAIPAFAKGGTPQNHQCMKDGQVIQKTKKECLKDGGKWEKMAAAPKAGEAAPVTPKPPTKPAPAKTGDADKGDAKP